MALFKKKKKEEEKPESAEATTGKKGTSMKDLYAEKSKKEEAQPAEKTSDKKADTGQKKTEDKKESKSKKKTPQKAYRILVKPLITEKVGDLAKENKYVFEVGVNANKIEVAEAIEEVYDIKPVKVNIVRMKGKRVRVGRLFGKRKNRKKAIVKLPEGKSISIHEGV